MAAAWLSQNGYRVLAMNWRKRFGEVDVIAEDGETLVFVEVKSRSSAHYGRPGEAVTRGKKIRIARAAGAYAVSRGLEESPMRFDSIEVGIDPATGQTAFRLWKDAFTPPLEFSAI
jgi:putative endonuclease